MCCEIALAMSLGGVRKHLATDHAEPGLKSWPPPGGAQNRSKFHIVPLIFGSFLVPFGSRFGTHFETFWNPDRPKFAPKHNCKPYLCQKHEIWWYLIKTIGFWWLLTPRCTPKWPKTGTRRSQEGSTKILRSCSVLWSIWHRFGLRFDAILEPCWLSKSIPDRSQNQSKIE